MGKPLRVLIVEDSEDDAALLVRELERGGYDPTFKRVETAQGMSVALARGPWDVIICDYNLPHFSAPAALMLAQKSGLDLPFVVVSGSIGEDVAVAAMKSGAHDYVMKGNLKRLVPAVERELREAKVRTECKQVEEAIRVSEEKFRAVAETANDAIVSADGHGNIMYFNKGAERIFGCPEAEVVGKPLTLLMPERFHDAHRQGINRFLSTGKAHVIGKTVELAGKRKDGTEFPMELSLATWKTGEEIFFAGILRDITERKQAEETIKYQAMYDALTGLPNRNMLYDRLCRALLDAQRENKSAALMLMDIDQFKEINDTLGHDRGDLLLKQIGPRLKGALHEGDLIARMGGDEFSVLLPLAESRHAVQVGNKIMRALEPPIEVEGLPIAVEVSIGIAVFPDHGSTPEVLIRRADIAMYAVKKTGGYMVYDSKLDRHSPGRLALLGELRQAIEHEELILHYQPKIGLQSGRIIGLEALVRWKHPSRGMIPPDQFIGPAERTGLIKPLTLWVFNTAQRQCLAWHGAGLGIPVSINLSARNLHDPLLPDQLAELMAACGGAPDRLELEITESTIMADPAHALDVIMRLRSLGIRFAIDDFGIGYSSLAYLRGLPVDAIKIDKSFVINMAENQNDAVIVRSTIDLVHNLGLKVVAEGVENQDILDRLVALGCDEAQGYYMARPMPAEELDRWLRESPWGLKA